MIPSSNQKRHSHFRSFPLATIHKRKCHPRDRALSSLFTSLSSRFYVYSLLTSGDGDPSCPCNRKDIFHSDMSVSASMPTLPCHPRDRVLPLLPTSGDPSCPCNRTVPFPFENSVRTSTPSHPRVFTLASISASGDPSYPYTRNNSLPFPSDNRNKPSTRIKEVQLNEKFPVINSTLIVYGLIKVNK